MKGIKCQKCTTEKSQWWISRSAKSAWKKGNSVVTLLIHWRPVDTCWYMKNGPKVLILLMAVRLITRRSEVRILSPLPFISYYINVLRRFLCLKIRSPYFYTPRYTPHTFQVLLTFLLFQSPEVQTNPTWCCFHH